VLFALLFAVSLPLWLIPLLWPVLPIALFGYFNQRVFRYDALAEHATAAEIAEVVRRIAASCFCWVSRSRSSSCPRARALHAGVRWARFHPFRPGAPRRAAQRADRGYSEAGVRVGAIIIGEEIIRGKREDKHFAK